MTQDKVTRRDFLRLSTLAAGGATLALAAGRAGAGMMGGGGGGGTGGGGMGGGSGTTVIDPPPGLPFAEPPEALALRTTGVDGAADEVYVGLEAGAEYAAVAGGTARMLAYRSFEPAAPGILPITGEWSYPGPTIRVKKGDLLKVRLKNSLSLLGTNMLGHDRDVTNLHTHGLHVSPSGIADNVMRMAMSGDTLEFEYDLSLQEAGTLNFYHPHIHGTVAEQYWGGLVGALVVEDDPASTVLSSIPESLLVLKDVTLSGGAPEPYTSMMDYMQGKEGTLVMVNGRVNPVLSVSPGEVRRLRVLNASNSRFYKLALEGHTLQLIGTEGGLLDRPYPLSAVVMAPGERVDLLVKASTTAGAYRLRSLAYGSGGMTTLQEVTLLTVECRGAKVRQSLPGKINPAAVRVSGVTPAATRRLVLSMGQGRGYINGVSFTDMASAMDSASAIHSTTGTWEVWEIVNQSGMDHPFHQHVNPCQVLSVVGGDPASAALYAQLPAWKDVVNIPRMGSARILVPVMDYDGMAMFHCHIVEHEDIGMMGAWHIMAGM
jgi:FtsP/CotA-like multicopper oxidase with cupredoxin domain